MSEAQPNEAAAEALLPWYVNGSLDAAERELVERALERSQTLRAELVRLERLGTLVADVGAVEPVPAADGFARLRRMMLASAPSPTARPHWTAGAGGLLGLLWRPAVVAGLATVVVIEAAAIATLVPASAPPRFVTAAGPAEGARAVVKFKPETTLSDIQSLLAAEQATIVRGPTPDGSLVVQWPGLGIDAVDRAIERLRANQAIVVRAERGT
jgi:anti-sigma-K factor RskA